MSFLSAFQFSRTGTTSQDELESIFDFAIESADFVKVDVKNMYAKILTDCIERTHEIPEKYVPAIWDNCMASETSKGLITLLAEAMAEKAELLLVYNKVTGVLRKADQDEAQKIKDDYKNQAKSATGIYVTFQHFQKTDLLSVYSSMEYDVLYSLGKNMAVAKAIQLKMSKMRDSVGNVDKEEVVSQAKAIVRALACGKDAMLDAEDEIASMIVDMEPTQKAIDFLDAKRAFQLNMPISYINGKQTTGIGSTGEADAKGIDRGLKAPFVSIIQPVLKALFGLNVKFKSQDFRQIDSALEAVKTLSLVDDNLISLENKRLIVSKLFDIENDLEGQPAIEAQDDNSEAEGDFEEDSAEDESEAAG